jgi:uncharacterized membrane protein YfcA
LSASPGRLAGALIGAVAGVASGMLGIGGGLVVTPALALRGVPLRRATGTALGAVLVCALVAVATEYATEPGHLFLLGALLIAVGAQLGVLAGRALLNAMPDAVLRTVFLLFLLFSAARSFGLLSTADEGVPPATEAGQGFAAESAGLMVVMMSLGIPAGISSVLFGIGGGVVVVPLLLWMGASFAQAAAISLLAMIPTALTGLWVAKRDDRIERGLLATLLPTAAAGAAAGVWLRNRALDAPLLETLFGVFLLYAALRLWSTRPRTG